MKTAITWMLLLIGVAFAAPAQDKTSPTYRLRFRLVETDAKGGQTTRNYALSMQNRTRGRINASHRLPYVTRTKDGGQEVHTVALGSIIECLTADAQGGVQVECSIESSYASGEASAPPVAPGSLPLIRSRQTSIAATLAQGQEESVALMDDPASGNRLEIFVAAERR